MEDGEESFEISEGNVKPEEESELSREDSETFKADSNTKITPNNILPIGDCIGDSNGSPGIDMEPEEAEEGEEFHGFPLAVPPVKQNSGYEDGVGDKGNVEGEGISPWPETDEDLSKSGATDNLMPAELTTDCTHPLMCLSDIASTLRPNSLPNEDGSCPDRMDMDLNESGQELSHVALSESGSAFDPSSPSEERTEVSSILHKEEFSEVDNNERFSESRPPKAGENEDFDVVDKVERTICKDIFRGDQNESLDKWHELSAGERLCPNGESLSSDSMLDSNQHDFNLSGTSSSPINRLSDLEKEPFNNSNSKQICDSEQTYVYDDKGEDGMCVESEMQNLSSEPGIEELPCETNEGGSSDVVPSGVCDKALQDEANTSEFLSDNKSSEHNVSENQCNGVIDFHGDSNQENVEWCDDVNMIDEMENRPDVVEDSSDSLEGKRKQTFDNFETEKDSLPGSSEGVTSAKMLKVDHKVAQTSQLNTVDRSATSAPSVSEPVEGRAFFPGHPANSQISDYSQYLGLQPTVKFKCVRCGERSFSSMMDLKTHQYACLKSHVPSQPNPSPAPLPTQTSSTNFRITRKVYLCSVCGTYYENWNLFLHMREVHKRHICLFCLGMFSRAERLSAHLVAKHNIVEGQYGNVEEFRLSCKGSVFLMCCSCEKVFSEEDSFSNHPCKDRVAVAKPSNNSLVSTKNQTSCPSTKTASVPFPEKKQTSKQAAAKSAESKAGKGGPSASARPKHILKVKIPIQPKKSDAPEKPVKTPKPKALHLPTPRPPVEKNGIEAIQPGLTEAHLDAISQSLFRSEEVAGTPSQPLDPNLMSNLDRTINAVALGITSEALEWQQRKNEELVEYQGLEEPAPLSSLDEAPKSDSDSNGPTILNFEPDENIDEMPAIESPAEPVPDIPAEQPEPSPPLNLPEVEPPRSEPEPSEELPPVEDVPPEQPEPEMEPQVAAPSPPLPAPPAEEPVPEKAPSPAEPEPALPERTPEESDIDSDDSDKLSLVVDETASGAENEEKTVPEEVSAPVESEPADPIETPVPMDEQPCEEPAQVESPEKLLDIPLAGEDVPITEVTIEEPLEEIPIQALLKECVKTLCYVCVYCSHARRIAVNGKQLALHTLAEHRFSPIDGSDKLDPLPTSRFTSRLKESVQVLQDMFFNTDTYDSTDKSSCLSYDRTYECFHCHFFTRSHKELYIHNRKMHQKTILLCIMCKSNFYSYSELLCHLCPGIYIPQVNVEFHCCMCDVDKLPSAFRLMVHLRKKHHACDVCLETTGDQHKLSSHVWKHKLHHLCYRCGIAYRNKPDITNHLFWKHGTESVLCKKCLQKKWPHVYHFCVPPATFTCEECSSLFTRAVSLRVHKRIHTGETPHPCTECEEKFISKKLLAKHTLVHRTPVPEEKPDEPMDVNADDMAKESPKEVAENAVKSEDVKDEGSDAEKERDSDKERKSKKKKHKEKEEEKKKVVDVYDLPPLNLSSESDSSDDEAKKEAPVQPAPTPIVTEPTSAVSEPVEEPQPTQVLGIWDNFTNFQKNLEKRENADAVPKIPTPEPQEDPNEALFKIVMMDHDYCAPIDPNNPPPEPVPSAEPEVKEQEEEEKSKTPPPEESKEPDTVTAVEENPALTPNHSRDDSKSFPSSESPSKKKRSPKKKTRRKSSSSSSGSSSGSDSSSCSCGTNCSCSSSSSSDSSSSSSDSDSSSSEGRRRAQIRRELRKERALEKKKEEEAAAAAAPPEEPHIDVMEAEPAFRESDLDTTETDTDEDFYDERPQKPPDESQVEKRNLMLLASVAPLNNGSTSPTPLQLDVQAALQQELNAQLPGGKKAKKKRRKKQAHYHSKMTLPPTHEVTPVLNVADSIQAAERFAPMYYAQSAPSPIPPLVQRHPSTPSFQQSTPELNSKKPLVTKLTREVLPNPGSGSETEGRTKRKRMPNKFYGYSSDEETEDHSSTQKWRKTEVTIAHTPPPPPPPVAPPPRPPAVSPLTLKRTVPSVPSAPPPISPITLQLSKRTIKTDSDSEESKRVTSSSSSSDSDDDAMQISEPPQHATTTVTGGGPDAPVRESNDNLYCYCQCPYDEVSEMIACDGSNCAIEWFHFECVGIMVPPKGQWYCPDCRKHMTGYQGIE